MKSLILNAAITNKYALISKLLLAVMLALSFGYPRVLSATTFWTEGYGSAWVYWSVPVGGVEDSERQSRDLGLTDMLVTGHLEGPAGNEALGEAWASLAIAGVGTYASAITPGELTYPAIGDASATLYDTLSFTVPAGTYTDDVVATVLGKASGFFSTTGGGNVYADFFAEFGSGNTASWHWDTGAVSEDYSLSYTLVNAGSVLNQPFTISLPIQQTLRAYATSSNTSISSAEADFSASARFLSVDVPTDVTWTSASGQFLVPIPAAVWLFGSGLIGLIGVARRKKA
jgi:hypothetical protein